MKVTFNKQLIKKAGIEILEEGRGEQVKQKLRCVKHNKIFTGILSHVVNRKQDLIMPCRACVKEAITSGTPVFGFNFFKEENEWALKLRLKLWSRFEDHKFVQTKGNLLVMFCKRANSRFVTGLQTEVGLNATDCPACGPAVEKQRLANINLANGKRYAERNTNPLVEYTEKGKVCVAHGNLWKCRVCHPYAGISKRKLDLVGLTKTDASMKAYRARLAAVRDKKLDEYLSKNGLKIVNGEIRVCEHKTVLERVALLATRKLRCLECSVYKPAREFFAKMHPKVLYSKFEPLSTQPSNAHYKVNVVNGKPCIFSTVSGHLRRITDNRPEAREHLQTKELTMAKRITKEEFRLRIITKHPEITPLAIKLDWTEGIPVKLRHTCGNVWVTKIFNVLKSKVGCPKCGRTQANHSTSLANLEKGQHKLDVKASKAGQYTALRAVPSANIAYSYAVETRCNDCTSVFTYQGGKLKCPRCSISGYGARSEISWEWLSNLERLLGVTIQGCNSKEATVTVGKKRYRVDGFHKPTNTVFEFLGDYWHGNPAVRPKVDKTDSYKKTIARLTELHEKYSVIYVWESAYKVDKRMFSGFMSHTGLPFIFPAQ